MVLLIDNYDSFSYNLVQLVGGILKERFEKGDNLAGKEDNYGIKVIRNDEMTVKEIEKLSPEYIILSPGPGRPADAGICEELLKTYAKPVRILGVCLGHQAICESFGGTITYAKELMHGKQSTILFDEKSDIFAGIPQNISIARYHSLAAVGESLPECLEVIARTEDGEVMAVKHREKDIYGFQFHPESVLTEYGREMLENFLNEL
ncbi:MAG: aminodeoxychorismate/anthranilate synthase component II [Clostridium sp.]|nr:aminodeoxychorismate/anthranilate synthase component II [Clostridium sp.]